MPTWRPSEPPCGFACCLLILFAFWPAMVEEEEVRGHAFDTWVVFHLRVVLQAVQADEARL